MTDNDITTTNGETFTHLDSVELARLVYRRFGRDPGSATAAWRRLLGNNATENQYLALVTYQEHTASCDGWCCDQGEDLGEGHQERSRLRAAIDRICRDDGHLADLAAPDLTKRHHD